MMGLIEKIIEKIKGLWKKIKGLWKKIKDILGMPKNLLMKYLPNNSEEEQLKIMEKIEEDFKKGNIVLPTGMIDYEDFKEFKKKTSHIKVIQNQLKIIEKNKPKGLVMLDGPKKQEDGKTNN